MLFPEIDPVALQIGPFAIRWYALAYIAGIVLGWLYVRFLHRRRAVPGLSEKKLEDLITWAVIGIIAGGRLGYVLFYNPAYYLEHPLEALKIWEGGMSFHGGLAGVLIAFALFARRARVAYLPLMDVIAAATPIGLFFGRIANFINGELFGRVTDSPLGMVFPHGGPQPRHPSQLYEAALEGLLLFALLFALVRFTRIRDYPGALGGVFLSGYALSRGTVEFFREPDAQLGFLAGGLTMGQILCLPMLAAGIFLIIRAVRREPLRPA